MQSRPHRQQVGKVGDLLVGCQLYIQEAHASHSVKGVATCGGSEEIK